MDVYILVMSGAAPHHGCLQLLEMSDMQHCIMDVYILVMSGAAPHRGCLHTCNVRCSIAQLMFTYM